LPEGTLASRETRPALSEIEAKENLSAEPPDVEAKKLAFAQTVAVMSPLDLPPASELLAELEEAAPPLQPSAVTPLAMSSVEPLDATLDRSSIPMATFQWVPKGKLGFWIAAAAVSSLAIGLAVFAIGRNRREAKAPAPATPPPVATAAEKPPANPPQAPAETHPSETAPAVEGDAVPKEEAISEDLSGRGLAYLTVHSTGQHASVYVLLTKYGAIENKLLVPCGRRFIAIGVPRRESKEPTWLAPGKYLEIPCGGSIELTMNPKRIGGPAR
jgi:hypothetical protein